MSCIKVLTVRASHSTSQSTLVGYKVGRLVVVSVLLIAGLVRAQAQPNSITNPRDSIGKPDSPRLTLHKPLLNQSSPEETFIAGEFPPDVRGRLVTALSVRDENNRWTSLTNVIVRSIDGKDEDITFPLEQFATDQSYAPFGPHFSPDGRFISMGVGEASLTSSYLIGLLNRQTQTLRALSERKLQMDWREWSPNSRYIAFVIGTTDYAGSMGPPPLTYRTVDVVTGQKYFVPLGGNEPPNISWSPRSTLLWDNRPTSKARPEVREVAAVGGRSRVLISNAWQAAISPNEKRIAFHGPEVQQNPEPLPPDSRSVYWEGSLCVAPLNNGRVPGRRRLLDRRQPSGLVRWAPDNRHLITYGPDRDPETRADNLWRILEYDVVTGRRRILWKSDAAASENEAEDQSFLSRGHMMNRNSPRAGVTKDGRYFWMTSQVEKVGFVLQFIDRRDGRLWTLRAGRERQGYNLYALDWHDESAPQPVATAPMATKEPTAPELPRAVFSGHARSCAGGIDNEEHRSVLRIHVARGKAPLANAVINLSFAPDTEKGKEYRIYRPPKLRGLKGAWQPSLVVRTDRRGEAEITVLSSQVIGRRRLMAQWNQREIGSVWCDFAAAVSYRRFPDWYDSETDTGWLFRESVNGKGQTWAKVFMKYRVDASRGDVPGNWAPVQGHRIRIRIKSAKLLTREEESTLTTPEEIQRRATFVAPKDAGSKLISPTSIEVTTAHDGSAQVVYKTQSKSGGSVIPTLDSVDLSQAG